ncbi:hypothetical protein [uncultured Aquimarina sp.]|uniref:hypothetical protein n=1 Tax=uncultured Aquimarina sp. TaxID=575652 RepID=UPI0026037EBA|nr:hypothetical protein [uncultured Aquimarina sp.]
MRLLVVCLTLLFIITCSSVKIESPEDASIGAEIKKDCIDTLILEKRENKIFNQFFVDNQKDSALSMITVAIEDLALSKVLINKEKNRLIKAFSKIESISSENLKIVKPASRCGFYFDNKLSVDLLDVNSDYNFFRPDGFLSTEEKDKEAALLKKYIDSSKVFFQSEPFYVNKGSYFKLNEEKNEFFSKNYEFYSNDGGDFFTAYKISNVLDYDTSGWLKSGIVHRSFFKHYSSEEKRFINNQEDETLDVIHHYTYFETKLDKNNSFIKSIIIYYVSLEGMNSSEKVDFVIKKDSLAFKNPVSK